MTPFQNFPSGLQRCQRLAHPRHPSARSPPHLPLSLLAMFNAQAASLFRSATGALSSRTLARTSAAAVGRRAAFGVRSRNYSDKSQSADQSKKAETEESDPEENEKDEVEVSPETTLLHKLKAEEAKVADCMVGPVMPHIIPAPRRFVSL